MFCFVHIEKAAGTTLHTIFLNNCFSYTIITPWPYWTNVERNAFLLEEIRQLRKILRFSRGFGGHTVRSYLGYEKILRRDIQYITFVREPIARYISHYNYQKNVMGMTFSFEDFLEQDKFSNFMTKRIAGDYNIGQAKENLQKQFSFVGLTERFDESLLLMKNIIFKDSFSLMYEKRNVAKQYETEKLRQNYGEQIRENNIFDIELYRFAQKNIYEKYVREYEGDLSTDVYNFQKKRESFSQHGGFAHRCMSRAYDVIFRRCERKIHKLYHESSEDYI